MKLWLSDEQVRELTGMQQPKSQMRVLDTLGYKYKMRSDNSFIVPVFGNFISDQIPTKQDTKHEMDFSSLG